MIIFKLCVISMKMKSIYYAYITILYTNYLIFITLFIDK